MSDSWFRFYNTAPDHPKVLPLTDVSFRAWVILLAMASKLGGTIPDNVDLIAKTIRRPMGKTREVLQILLSAELIDRIDGGYTPHNWEAKQFKSDGDSTERVRKYRERVRANGGKVGRYLEFRNFIFERDGNACIYCGATEPLVVDHVMPVIRGGTDHPWNLATACKGCNSGKAGRDPFEAGLSFSHERFRVFCNDAVTRSVTVTETAHRQSTETETEKKNIRAPRALDGFDAFYAAFPLKKAPRRAETAYAAALKRGATPEVLLAAAQRYAADPKRKKDFTQHPATWLNGDCWREGEDAPAQLSADEIERNEKRREALFGPRKFQVDA